MDYRQALEFIARTGKYGSVFGLDGIRGLMARLGNVHEQLPVIHIAGTNGKGSVSAMLSSILQAAGYRTGTYCSPAVFEPEEIIKMQGNNISKEAFAAIAGDVQAACLDMRKEGLPHPTAFEVETAIAFCFFSRSGCEIAVVETGLGGELDATNLIAHPVCSILTSIGRDHMGILGESLTDIAKAKAGIIKEGCPCVTAAQKPEVMEVIMRKAAVMHSELCIADTQRIRTFTYDGWSSHFETVLEEPDTDAEGNRVQSVYFGEMPLTGAFQKENLACVLEAAVLLQKKKLRITPQAVLEGLSGVRLSGRFERIRENPDFYIDGAHNESAALVLRETVQNCFTKRRVIYIIGVLADKEYGKLLEIMLPYADAVFTVTPDNPRALDGRQLARQAEGICKNVTWVSEIPRAAMLAQKAAGSGGVVLAFGSFTFLGELKQAVRDRICMENGRNTR